MADVVPVEAGAIVLRDAASVVPPPRWAARLARRRMIVASGVRALTSKQLLPASTLAVAALAAARAAAGVAGRHRATRGPVGAEAVDRMLSPVARGVTLHVSWTHVEMHWRG
jgi:hypothetical protein